MTSDHNFVRFLKNSTFKMDDPKFAAGLSILRHLTAEDSATRARITLTTINLFISFRKINNSSCYLMSLLACYRLAAKMFENAISTIGIRKKLTTSPIPNEIHHNLAIFGISNPDSQINTTLVSRAIESCELSIIAALHFRFRKTKPDITLVEYLNRTFSWFHPDVSSGVFTLLKDECCRYMFELLNQVIFIPKFYRYDDKVKDLGLTRIVLERFMIPINYFGRRWERIIDSKIDVASVDCICLTIRESVNILPWSSSKYYSNGPNFFDNFSFRVYPIETGSNIDCEPRCSPPDVDFIKSFASSTEVPPPFIRLKESQPRCPPPVLAENDATSPVIRTKGFEFSHRFRKTKKYRYFHSDQRLVDQIFRIFRSKAKSEYTLVEIADGTGIPSDVLCKWRRKFDDDASYIPGVNYGLHRRRFTSHEEKCIADFIRIQYIFPGIAVRRKHLRQILFDLWKSLDLENRGRISRNCISECFLDDFCKRNRLSFRRMRKKKRSEINEDEVEQYTRELTNVMATMPMNRILNMDETCCNFVHCQGEVLAETATENVDAVLTDDHRKSFTAIGTIAASGDKFPPIFLARGKTDRCHAQFKNMTAKHSDYFIFHAVNGVTDDRVMEFYLQRVSQWMKGKPSALVLDRFPAHRSETTHRHAQIYNIRLIFVPTSGTERYQPLDTRSFGVTKSKLRALQDDHAFETMRNPSRSEVADFFVKAWNQLSSETIVASWCFDENYSDDEKSESQDETESSFSENSEEYEEEEEM